MSGLFSDTPAVSGFAVDDIEAAKAFYGEKLGVRLTEQARGHLLTLHLTGSDGARDTIIYKKTDFQPATYTILNFVVEDIDAAVDELLAKGVVLERYDDLDQDEKGISRRSPLIAWFKDPAGNILSVLQES
jgi:catechol 2,3-dioxygenase-like lactoylglutathione lyase family enzyme